MACLASFLTSTTRYWTPSLRYLSMEAASKGFSTTKGPLEQSHAESLSSLSTRPGLLFVLRRTVRLPGWHQVSQRKKSLLYKRLVR